jgi:hypothetical protein
LPELVAWLTRVKRIVDWVTPSPRKFGNRAGSLVWQPAGRHAGNLEGLAGLPLDRERRGRPTKSVRRRTSFFPVGRGVLGDAVGPIYTPPLSAPLAPGDNRARKSGLGEVERLVG